MKEVTAGKVIESKQITWVGIGCLLLFPLIFLIMLIISIQYPPKQENLHYECNMAYLTGYWLERVEESSQKDSYIYPPLTDNFGNRAGTGYEWKRTNKMTKDEFKKYCVNLGRP